MLGTWTSANCTKLIMLWTQCGPHGQVEVQVITSITGPVAEQAELRQEAQLTTASHRLAIGLQCPRYAGK